jgi:hypothetical protein
VWVLAAATFVVSWLILALTAPGIPIVWDEGEYLFRAQRVIEWFQLRPFDFSQHAIEGHWLFINYSEGHPAGFVLPIALGRWIASPFVDPLTAARLGPITLFSVACAAVAVRLKHDYGRVAAIAAPLTLLTFPRVFSEAHFATQDGQLTAWWLILWSIQSTLARGTGTMIALGLVLGLTTATKFTGWLAWPATVLSETLKPKSAARSLLILVPVAMLTFYIVNPPLWHAPLVSLYDHFHRNLDRAHTHNISMLFLGHVYDVERPLPWYNTIVWLVLVTPVLTLALGVIGVWQSLRHPTAGSLALVLHWITLMVARALPGAPPHDGIRLFLPPFGFWCVFAAIGAHRVFSTIAGINIGWHRQLMRVALVSAFLASAANLVRYFPQTLSHYSALVGGIRGAAAMGMEPAYWWDSLDKDVLTWLNEHTPPAEPIAFSTIANTTLLREWGKLHPKDVDPEKASFRWYVLQNRPGIFSPTDTRLMRRETPVFVKYAGRRSAHERVPADLDVPLISIFSFEQYQRARR